MSLPAAERKTSLGKDWHKSCLKCTKCKKVLAAGSHAEVRGVCVCVCACDGGLACASVFVHELFIHFLNNSVTTFCYIVC